MDHREQCLSNQPPLAANEQGFILVMALVMLVILSIMGTAAMTVRNTEVAVVANAEVMQNNFYALEAVTLEGTTALENTADGILLNVATAPLPWLKPNDPATPPVIDLSTSSAWLNRSKDTELFTEVKIEKSKIYRPGYTTAGNRIQYAAVQGSLASDATDYDLCKGSDRSDGTKLEKCYSVYGMYDVKSGVGKTYSGRRMLMVGYKKTVYTN
jgi:Tfp pilus assembly protein PilX